MAIAIKQVIGASLLVAATAIPMASQASELGTLKGIKWKQELPARGGEFNDRVYGRLDRPKDINGNYVTWDRLATQLKQKGVEAVAFRIDREDRYIDENGNGPADEMATYYGQVKKISGKLEDKGIKVFLFARIWLSNKDNQYVFDRFDTYLSTLTEEERNIIDGIALTESHLEDIKKVKTRARWIPSKFENAYPGWLKERAFIMPGLGNGFRFNGIDQDDDFHNVMNNTVGEFAFSVKAMRLKASDDPDNIYQQFPNFLNWAGKSIEEREAYIGDYIGINELVSYQESAQETYPNTANIVFWGDSGDSLSNIHPKGAQALHNVLNQNGGKNHRGMFMYAGVGGISQIEDPNNPDHIERVFAKSVIEYDEQTDKHRRHALEFGKWENVLSTYDQWFNWSQDVYMNGNNPFISLDAARYTAETAAECYDLGVSSNVYWQVTKSANWLSIDNNQGFGERTLSISISENETTEQRSTTLLINDVEHNITQLGLADFDDDGIPDSTDPDDDSDGFADEDDAFPFNNTEWLDTDLDGIGNNEDNDDDNDLVLDEDDAFPLDAFESADFDNDGIGDNADTDDDNDGVSDALDQHLGLVSGNVRVSGTESGILDRVNANGVSLSIEIAAYENACNAYRRSLKSLCFRSKLRQSVQAGSLTREEAHQLAGIYRRAQWWQFWRDFFSFFRR